MARAERSAAFGSSSLKPGDRRGPAGAGVSSFHRASLSAGPDGEGARFAELLDRCERLGTRTLPFDDLRELGRLYRLHAARLARLRDRGDDPEAIRHLNALCVRAYTTLYARPAREPSATPPLLQRLPGPSAAPGAPRWWPGCSC